MLNAAPLRKAVLHGERQVRSWAVATPATHLSLSDYDSACRGRKHQHGSTQRFLTATAGAVRIRGVFAGHFAGHGVPDDPLRRTRAWFLRDFMRRIEGVRPSRGCSSVVEQ